MSQKSTKTSNISPPTKCSRFSRVLRSASKQASESKTSPSDECSVEVIEEQKVAIQQEEITEIKQEIHSSESESADVDKNVHSCLRRQPRRFVHTKPFSQGLADRDTADWLKEHFYSKRGSLVPKGFLCERYEEFCETSDRKPMNNATLGRFIRGVFPKLETRRLGARQQSRYFYNNLGIRTTSPYCALIRNDMRPLSIRRNKTSLNKNSSRSVSPSEEDLYHVPDKSSHCLSASKIPPYLLGFPQRKMADTRQNIGDGQEQTEDGFKCPEDDAVAFLLSSAEQNKDKSKQLFHEDLVDLAWMEQVKSSLPAEATISQVLGSLFLTYNISAVPWAMDSFWLHETTSVQIPENFNWDNVAPILTWPKLQQFLHICYLHMFQSIVSSLINDFLDPVDDRIWRILFSVAQRFSNRMEHVTANLPHQLGHLLASGARAFSQCLRDRLCANYDANYIRSIAADKNVISLLTNALILYVIKSEFLVDCAFWLEEEKLADLQQALQNFVNAAGREDLVPEWVSWMRTHFLDKINKEQEMKKKLNLLRILHHDWIVFLTSAENAVLHFKGDADLKTGFFSFCHNLMNMIIREIEGNLTERSAIELYSQMPFLRIVRTEKPLANSEAHDPEWCPEFVALSYQPSVDLQSTAFFQTFPQLSGIVYDINQSGAEIVRTSNRAGRGRNRWLEECD